MNKDYKEPKEDWELRRDAMKVLSRLRAEAWARYVNDNIPTPDKKEIKENQNAGKLRKGNKEKNIPH